VSDTVDWQRFSADDVRVLSLAFDHLCELTGLGIPSDKLAARFAEIIVTVAQNGDRNQRVSPCPL
jgi:hypothetical protein